MKRRRGSKSRGAYFPIFGSIVRGLEEMGK
jgi:hypothetical protein